MKQNETPLGKFQKLLAEMLQTDKSDLDFGAYRVVNRRISDIKNFINQTIPRAIADAVEKAQPHNTTLVEMQQLEATIRRQYGNHAFTPDGELKTEFAEGEIGRQWREIKRRAKDIHLLSDEDVCNRLLQFFARYYDNGDFLSKRRYAGTERFAVPHDGREILLHWANRDQYYIKTADRFAQYAFKANGLAVQFKAEPAKVQKDNNQPPRGNFILHEVRRENGRVVAAFHQRELTDGEKETLKRLAGKIPGDAQTKLIALAEQRIADEHPDLQPLLAPHIAQREKTIFTVHAERFVRRNTSDFFIHRNLRAFLQRELDFFLKNETINADELAEHAPAQNRIAAFRAVRAVGRKIIDFLAQWEDFQKSLWEKKKFILQTDYCATLGRIPNAEQAGICKDIADCDKQWKEWKCLGIDGKAAALFSGKGKRKDRLAFLRDNPSLPVDTANFPPEFKDRLLAQFPNLDDATDGILIHGENWQALNLLQEMFRERVKCIHIDPPYNTDTSGFLYKNDFQHSSWLTMMDSRISAAIPLLSDDGVFQCHIDENEYERLNLLFEQTPTLNAGTVIWDKRNPVAGGLGVATQHEYVIWRMAKQSRFAFEKPNAGVILQKAAELVEKGGGVNDKVRKEFKAWIRRQDEFSVGERSYCEIEDSGRVYQSVHMGAPERRQDAKFYVPLHHPKTGKPCPVPQNGWAGTPKFMRTLLEKGRILFGKDESVQPRRKYYLDESMGAPVSSVFSHGGKGKGDLDKLGLEFPYCHPVALYEHFIGAATSNGNASGVVLDFFAGSGTTAHAVLNLNRADDGGRKFILAEMGDYFQTVFLPRVKKIIYAPEWKKGKPACLAMAQECERGPRLVKYHRLESYEDALDNVEFRDDAAMRKLDDFIPRYMLRWESRESPTFLSDAGLESPFDYALELSGEGRRKERADLPETFAYLIGLRVRERKVYLDEGRRYVVHRGEIRGEASAVVWRDVSGWKQADFERDRDFIEREGLTAGAKRVFVNRDSLLADAEILDSLFRAGMFPPLSGEDSE